MQKMSFLKKYSLLFLFALLSTSLAANTMVNEYGIGINGVKTTFEIKKEKDFKWMHLSVDFQKILQLKKEAILNSKDTKDGLESLNPKVVIDDVVVFLDADMKMEGMMVYNSATSSAIGQVNHLPTYSPG